MFCFRLNKSRFFYLFPVFCVLVCNPLVRGGGIFADSSPMVRGFCFHSAFSEESVLCAFQMSGLEMVLANETKILWTLRKRRSLLLL